MDSVDFWVDAWMRRQLSLPRIANVLFIDGKSASFEAEIVVDSESGVIPLGIGSLRSGIMRCFEESGSRVHGK